MRTALVVEQLEHFANDLADALEGLEIILGLFKLLVEITERDAHCET